MKFTAFAVAVAANRYENMNEDDLLVNLDSTLSSALSSEARGDADAAVAKTSAIKNIQKSLTAKSSRDSMTDSHSLMSPKDEGHRGYAAINQRYGEKTRYHQSVEPVLENAIKTLQKVVDVRGMGKK